MVWVSGLEVVVTDIVVVCEVRGLRVFEGVWARTVGSETMSFIRFWEWCSRCSALVGRGERWGWRGTVLRPSDVEGGFRSGLTPIGKH